MLCHRARAWCVAAGLAALLRASPRLLADGGAGASPAEAIAAAEARGLEYLKSRQHADGSWGEIDVSGTTRYAGAGSGKGYSFPLGPTALALYALLGCGVAKDDLVVKKGFAWLERAPRSLPAATGLSGVSAYEMSALVLAVTARGVPPAGGRPGEALKLDPDDRKRVQGAIDALLKSRAAAKTLGWRYDLPSQAAAPGGNEDLSSTGLAALALFAAERCGLKVQSDVWNDLVTFALKQQEPSGPEHDRAIDDLAPGLPPGKGLKPAGADGTPPAPPAATAKDRARGFSYIRSDTLEADEGKATGGMTASGIAVIQAARLVLGRRGEKAWASREAGEVRRGLYDGCAWLDAHWSAFSNPEKQASNIYNILYLQHVAEAMDLLGSGRVGSHDWRGEMASELLARQKKDGSWDSNSSHPPRDVLDTSFALLFLARPLRAPAPPDAPAPGGGGK